MDKEQLNKLLAHVNSELRNAGSMDPDRKQALQEIATEIQRALDGGDQGPGLKTLAARLRLQIEKLEVSHPNLTLSIGELIDALAKIGV